jgi:hypothetical protein
LVLLKRSSKKNCLHSTPLMMTIFFLAKTTRQ